MLQNHLTDTVSINGVVFFIIHGLIPNYIYQRKQKWIMKSNETFRMEGHPIFSKPQAYIHTPGIEIMKYFHWPRGLVVQ